MNTNTKKPSGNRKSPQFTGAIAVMLTLILAATACAPKQDRRTAGVIIDDQTAEAQIIDALYSRPEFDEQDHIKVEAHNAVLLLAGETKSEDNRLLAGQLASELKSVERVVNELAVMPVADTGGRFDNTYMTTKVNTVLLTKNPVQGFDPTRIKVITARRNVYLMGTVSQAEADAVADVVRNIGGVEKVIKVFDYTD